MVPVANTDGVEAEEQTSGVSTTQNTTICRSIQVRESRTCPDPWKFWNDQLKSPKRVLAPMVDQSELPFRLLCRARGVNLAYTPMWHAKLFSTDPKYRKRMIPNVADGVTDVDRPLFAHFCANDPDTLSDAVRVLREDVSNLDVDAIDLNFGCPQGIAKKGNYGSFLLSNPDLMISLVKELDRTSHVPITCKIRLVNETNLEDTIALVKRLENAGAAVICVHGRTKENKSQLVTECDWKSIRLIKEAASIPIIANGGVETYEDAMRLERYTKADAVMSALGILEYPGLFQKPMETFEGITELEDILKKSSTANESTYADGSQSHRGINYDSLTDFDEIVDEYLALCQKYPPAHSSVKAHLFHFLHSPLQTYPEMRAELGKTRTLDDCFEFVKLLKEKRRADSALSVDSGYKLKYYRRYRKAKIDVEVLQPITELETSGTKRPADISLEKAAVKKQKED